MSYQYNNIKNKCFYLKHRVLNKYVKNKNFLVDSVDEATIFILSTMMINRNIPCYLGKS